MNTYREEIQQSLQNTKHFLNDAVNKVSHPAKDSLENLSNYLNEALKIVTEASSSAVDKIAATTEKAKYNLTEVTNQAIETVTATANQAQNSLSATASQAIDRVHVVTTQAVGTVTATAEQAKMSLAESMQKAEQLSNATVEAWPGMIVLSLQDWLEAHPILAWLLIHPLATLAIFLVFLLLLSGLLRGIVQLTDKVWLAILKSPFQLGQWLLKKATKMFKSQVSPSITSTQDASPSDKQERLAYILNRLEEINQEQEELLKEMNIIVLQQ